MYRLESDANAATSVVLGVLDTSSAESLMSTARWVVQQGEKGPAGAGHRASLSCLYSWLCEDQGQWQGTPVLGDWVMSFIKALEVKHPTSVIRIFQMAAIQTSFISFAIS